MDANFDTDDFDMSNLTHDVTAISICGLINENNEGDENGNPPTNHWIAFLEHPNGSSIRLDMMPGYGSDGLRGKIQLLSGGATAEDSFIKTLRFSTIGTHAVQDIVDLILRKKRDQYSFTDEEEGCRYWIHTFISDLEEIGILRVGSKEETWEAVSMYWKTPTGSELRIVRQGRFR